MTVSCLTAAGHNDFVESLLVAWQLNSDDKKYQFIFYTLSKKENKQISQMSNYSFNFLSGYTNHLID